MTTVGLTGGIGSGKTTAAKFFELLGIPVFYADGAGRQVLDSDPKAMEGVSALFGAEIYVSGKADRKAIAARVFSDEALLAKLNAIVHPAVGRAFAQWKASIETQVPYIMKEAAILFESGTYRECDKTIVVSAPQEERVRRVMQRDAVSRDAVLERMARQWPEGKKKAMADFVAINDGKTLLAPQLLAIHNTLCG